MGIAISYRGVLQTRHKFDVPPAGANSILRFFRCFLPLITPSPYTPYPKKPKHHLVIATKSHSLATHIYGKSDPLSPGLPTHLCTRITRATYISAPRPADCPGELPKVKPHPICSPHCTPYQTGRLPTFGFSSLFPLIAHHTYKRIAGKKSSGSEHRVSHGTSVSLLICLCR
ncbi:hypothetical protein PUMCH_004039 [Australozyma saopauloensis]|uniref:Uncharacterized protein n=1 Tax=Australozyma saopauloensis TaxID=291208 RepID=A0AAX4HE08_9ASCO|nr:hypothetical protein PUMCH_004039 [[Candida] saopauloensis]